MAEPAWAQVLSVMYHQGKSVTVPFNLEDLDDEHALVEETNLGSEEVANALEFLYGQNLVDIWRIPDDENDAIENENPVEHIQRQVEIEPDGFEVAHEREQSHQQIAGNYAIAALTAVLATTSLIETSIAYSSGNLDLVESVALGVMLMAAGVVFLVYWWQIQRAGALDLGELISRNERRQQ